MAKRCRNALNLFLLAADVALTVGALHLALHTRRWLEIGGPAAAEEWFFRPTLTLQVIVALTWAFFLSFFSVYTLKRTAGLLAELKAVGLAICASLGVLACAIFLLNYDEFSRLIFAYFALIDLFVLLNFHILSYVVTGLSGKACRVLVVGTGPLAQKVVDYFSRQRKEVAVVGFLDHQTSDQNPCQPILGDFKAAPEVVTQWDVDEVVIALPYQDRESVAGLHRSLQDLPVRVWLVPGPFDQILTHATLEELVGIHLISLREPPMSVLDRVAKRLFDLIASILGLIILSPLMLLMAVAIKLDSPGPVIFKQTRLGKKGRPFTFYKFRSMHHKCDDRVHREYYQKLIASLKAAGDAEKGRIFKMTEDCRVTGVGRFLRKSSLDELPQLFNVIKGDMSLVGPRPPIPYEVEEYEEWHKRRLEALPGITGIWQVEGRSLVPFDEMVLMDLEYIEKRSFWLDLLILLRTPWVVISGKGAE